MPVTLTPGVTGDVLELETAAALPAWGTGAFAFMIHSHGRFEFLHHFGRDWRGALDGIGPSGSLLTVSPGHVLGTCPLGGLHNWGTLWSLHLDAVVQ